MYCSDCGTYFLPALIISDGTPKNEMQFLCRVQTADAIERFFMEKGMNVLTGKNENLLRRNGLRAVRNDIILRRLESRQTLISNLLQYTPANLILNLIDGSNIQKGDALFGEWRKQSA
jgi:hypothetical protein